MRYFALTVMMVASIGLLGCQTSQWGTKQSVGTGVGAVAGGLAGSQIGGGSGRLWATGAGALLGALVGSEVGASLDRADRMYMSNAQQEALQAPIGETVTWNNPESPNYGSYTPVREGVAESGSYCREYQQTIYVNGQQETGYGTACQQPDGSWKIVS